MASFTLKNVPNDLLEQLRTRAAANNRSLNQEIIFCLRKELAQPKRTLADAEAIVAALERIQL